MTFVARLFLFILIFTVNVKVKAAVVQLPTQKDITQEPKDCLNSDSTCALKTHHGAKYELQINNGSIVMDESTSIVRKNSGEFVLVSGTIWIKSKAEIKIETEFGEVTSSGGEFWIHHDQAKVIASAIEGDLTLTGHGSGIAMRVESGEENWLGPVGSDGKSTSGIPCAIAFDEHVKRWARLYSGPKPAFEADVKSFHSRWTRSLASVAQYHSELAERRRAVLAKEAEASARIKAQEESRSSDMRALFRRKMLFE
jgi:hypothetical protein